MALQIFYPNGMVEASLMYIWSGGVAIPWDGNISVVSSGSAINDGVDPAIKATVLDLLGTGSQNPLAVILTDANGDPYVAGSPANYALETGGNLADAVAHLSEIGSSIWVAGSAIGPGGIGILGSDGVNARFLKTDNTGILQIAGTATVSGTVTANAGTNLNTSLLALEAGGNLAAIKAKTDNIPALGQALAAGSVPVVLTAAQLTTLTPPAAITNYALETGGKLADLNTVLGVTTGAAVITDANGAIQQYLRGLVKLAIQSARGKGGTAQTCINTSTDIAAGNFSGSPAATFDNTSDSIFPYAQTFLATLQMPDWGAAPTAGQTVSLYLVFQNTDGTSDDTDAPSGTANGGGFFATSWTIAGVDALQRRTMPFVIPVGITAFDAYIKNETTQNMNNDAGTNCTLKISPTGWIL